MKGDMALKHEEFQFESCKLSHQMDLEKSLNIFQGRSTGSGMECQDLKGLDAKASQNVKEAKPMHCQQLTIYNMCLGCYM